MLQETSTGQKSMWQINKINTRQKANYQLQYKYTIKSQDQAWGVRTVYLCRVNTICRANSMIKISNMTHCNVIASS